jgi:molecular chaperone GrpE
MPKPKKPDAQQLQKQVEELTKALQHERADAVNLRRRSEEERVKMAAFYKAKVVRDLMPAMDNLERALKHLPKELETKWDLADEPREWVKGVKRILEQFEQNLNQMGVEKIKTVGEKFDPSLHEAIHMEEGDGEVEVVCEELQPGYKIGDEVIRHAIVKVKMEKK